MVKNYTKKPLNAATSGYTPPPPTGTPIYQPDEEAEIPAKKANLPPRRMNPPAARPTPVNANSVPPVRYPQNNNVGLPNSLPSNYGQQYVQPPPMYNNQPQQQPQYNQPQYNQPQYGQPQYGQPQYGQPQYNQPQYSPPQQYSQPPQQYNNAPPIPQRHHNSPPVGPQQYQPSPNAGPMIPPRKDRYETNYNTTGNPYYSEPTYRMPCPK